MRRHARRNWPPLSWSLAWALTIILCGVFGYVSYNNVRLSREVQTRIGFERRLTAVIDELNHRVKNILAVIQSIVTRTMRHGADMDVARDLLMAGFMQCRMSCRCSAKASGRASS